MKFANVKAHLGISTALAFGVFMSSSATATTPGGGFSGGGIGGGFSGGGCSVSRESGGGAVFYVPRGGNGSYNILGWGNGTGLTTSSYSGLLTAAAERCVLVAAATTTSSGSGRAVASAVNQAKSRYRNIVGDNPKVCTSGHSQGGGGSFNAARQLNANCVIAIQPDTVYTTRIYGPVSRNTDVVCIFSMSDTLAPSLPFNGSNCRRNATRYSQEMTSGTHFAPTYGSGGSVGSTMRSYINRWLAN